MGGKNALVFGGTGLIGRELIKYLLESREYDKVIAIGRRALGINHLKLEELLIELDEIESHREIFVDADVFCSLGTTIKKARTKEAFQRVDLEYPVEIAKQAKKKGVGNFLVVSSIGADANSPSFYLRTKGQMEEALKAMGFDALYIFRPSLLLGSRQEFRLGEALGAKISQALFFIFLGPLKKYKPIKASVVARAMYQAAQREQKGLFIYASHEIVNICSKQWLK